MVHTLLVVAAVLQCVAVAYGLFLLSRRRGATGAWLCLLGAMLSMLVWRLVVVSGLTPPPFFNPLIAIWGSTFMVAAMFLFGREVLARQRAEVERDALLDSERAARMEAEQASRLKDEFLATLSHELRSPLSAILGWCAVLQRARGKQDEIERGLDIVERNARAQTRLVDDLLDVTRMRAGTLRLNVDNVPLDAPVRTAVQGVRPMADAKQLQLDLHLAAKTPQVAGDFDRLQQIATNLLVNAIKFSPPHGTISVAVRERDGKAELVVKDAGEGIDESFLPHVFTRFRQADSSTARRHGGLGLGLAIVDHLVRMHGGTVRAESAGLGKGATFTVTLPVGSATGASPGIDSPVDRIAQPITEQSLRELRVLIVDDEEDVRSAVSRLLEQHGATVKVLGSGSSIREMLIEHRPHVLLVDIGMPQEDGYTMIRRVRGFPASEGGLTPAISLTAHARNEDRARALASGFDEHLPKPVDVPVLVMTIRGLAREFVREQTVA